jgi:hypothetical protein
MRCEYFEEVLGADSGDGEHGERDRVRHRFADLVHARGRLLPRRLGLLGSGGCLTPATIALSPATVVAAPISSALAATSFIAAEPSVPKRASCASARLASAPTAATDFSAMPIDFEMPAAALSARASIPETATSPSRVSKTRAVDCFSEVWHQVGSTGDSTSGAPRSSPIPSPAMMAAPSAVFTSSFSGSG